MAATTSQTRLESLFSTLEQESLVSVPFDGGFLFSSPSHTILEILNSFRLEGDNGFCDVVLEVEGQQFPAHRCVLAANSPFFRSLFGSGMKESSQRILSLKSIPAAVIPLMLQFFYTREISIEHSVAKELLDAANFLLVSPLKDACLEVLCSDVSINNCFSARRTAEKYSAIELANKVDSFIKKNFSSISQESVEFLNLSGNEIFCLLTSDDTQVEKEEDVYHSLLRWVKHDSIERCRVLVELLREIRLVCLPKEFLLQQLRDEPLIRSSSECRNLLRKITEKKKKKKRKLPDINLKERPSTQVLDVIVGVGNGNTSPNQKIFCYVVQSKETFSLPQLSGSQCQPELAVVDRTIYAIGGCEYTWGAYEPVDIVQRCTFDIGNPNGLGPRELKWERIESLHAPTRCHSVAVLNGCIFAIGGTNDGLNNLNKVECYNPKRNEWSFMASLNHGRSLLCSVATESHIYAIGGRSNGILSTVERYDPVLNTWAYVAPLKVGRINPSGTCLNDKIYIIGGQGEEYQSLTSCEVYSVKTNEWHSIASTQYATARPSLLNVRNQMILLAGSSSLAGEYKAVKYNAKKNSWQKVRKFGPDHIEISKFTMCALQLPRFYLQDMKVVPSDFFELKLEDYSTDEFDYDDDIYEDYYGDWYDDYEDGYFEDGDSDLMDYDDLFVGNDEDEQFEDDNFVF